MPLPMQFKPLGFFFFKSFFCLRGRFLSLPWDFLLYHNDPAAHQDHCGRCRIRTRDLCREVGEKEIKMITVTWFVMIWITMIRMKRKYEGTRSGWRQYLMNMIRMTRTYDEQDPDDKDLWWTWSGWQGYMMNMIRMTRTYDDMIRITRTCDEHDPDYDVMFYIL